MLAHDARPVRAPSALRLELSRWPLNLWIGGGLFLLVLLGALFAPWLTPYDPYRQDYGAILLPPSWAHPFGTDMNGRPRCTATFRQI